MKEFWQIDCFTTQPLCGNPAAVVFDCDGKSAEWMQAISREMNLSETVFFVKPTKADVDYHVRFFTPRRELPFAGHPTIAAAHAFLEKYGSPAGVKSRKLRQECKAGVVPIELREDQGTTLYVMQQRAPEYQNVTKTEDFYAHLLGCDGRAIVGGPIQVVSTGVPWLIVQLGDGNALDSLAPRFVEIEQECRELGAAGITVFALGSDGSSSCAHLRTFAPGEGVLEDPVCGSGNGAVGAYIARHIFGDRPIFDYQALQGRHVKRPGQAQVRWARDNGDIQIYVGGAAVKVLEGEILA